MASVQFRLRWLGPAKAARNLLHLHPDAVSFSSFLRVSGGTSAAMKAKLVITPKKAVLDPQGKTVANALEHMGYAGVTSVRVGKYIEIDLAPGTSATDAHKALNEAALRFLSNPVIEDYRLEIVE
jgi:phosphoribosylformylglycinamidine synthase